MSQAQEHDFEKCPNCGRFVSRDDGFGDVEPGGCRGHDYVEPYCNAECADAVYKREHERMAREGRECHCE